MSRLLGSPWVSWPLRLVLGGLFLYAGATKWMDPSEFALEISRYELFPELSAYAAATLPSVELVLGAGLVFLPFEWRRSAALGVLGLMAVFTAAAASAVARGLDIACGCFGDSSGALTWTTLVRDVALLTMAAVLVFARAPNSLKQPA